MKKMKFWSILILAMMSIIAYGQEIKQYEGEMNLPKDLYHLQGFMGKGYNFRHDSYPMKGSGKYSYYENAEEDRIKHGPFKFIFTYGVGWNIEITGSYSHGKKEGVWTVKEVETEKDVKRYVSRVGQQDLTITYSNDLPNGSFKLIKGGSDYKYTITCNLVNGIVIGDVSNRFQRDKIDRELSGKVGEDGLPTGIWTVTDNGAIKVVQKRYYMNGALIYVSERDESTGEKSVLFSTFPDMKISDIESINNENPNISLNNRVAKKNKFYSELKSLVSFPFGNKMAWYFFQEFPGSFMIDYNDGALNKQRMSWEYVYEVR